MTDALTQPNPLLQRLSAFVGEWTWQATLDGQPYGKGRTVFGWLEGGAFQIQHSDAEQPEFPNGTMIIGSDDSSPTYTMLYFDSRGVSRIYHMSLDNGAWKLWRDAPPFSQRFIGAISEDGRTITGRWEQSEDGSHWEKDFDLTYTKQARE